MADRDYDRKLKCGCEISADGGGGCLPCNYYGYDDSTEEDVKRCKEAWDKWMKTDDYKLYRRQRIERNNSDKYLKEMIDEDEKVKKLFEETGGIPKFVVEL